MSPASELRLADEATLSARDLRELARLVNRLESLALLQDELREKYDIGKARCEAAKFAYRQARGMLLEWVRESDLLLAGGAS